MVMNDEMLKAIEDVGFRIVEAKHQYFVGCQAGDEEYIIGLKFLLGDLKAYLIEKETDPKSADTVFKRWVAHARDKFIELCQKNVDNPTDESRKDAGDDFDNMFKSDLKFYS